jgi:predicted nuclease with TOPRIM domain
MSEDLTQNLPSPSFEERVLAELSAIRQEQSAQRETLSQLDARLTSLEERMASLEGRMTTLEQTVDARLHDTRPMWEAVQERLTGIEKEMRGLNRHLKIFAGELGVLRNRVDELEEDVGDLAQSRS